MIQEKYVDISTGSFKHLEEEFQKVLNSLTHDHNLEKYKTEYEKLYCLLVQSHSKEKSLVQQVEDLNKQILRNAKKVASAIELSARDQSTILELKEEIKKAWKMVEIAKEKEKVTTKTIEDLSIEISDLSQRMSVENRNDEDSEFSLENLTKARSELRAENENLDGVIEDLEESLRKKISTLEKIQSASSRVEKEIQQINEEGMKKVSECETLTLEKEEKEKLISDVTTDLDNSLKEIELLKNEVETKKKISADVLRKTKTKTSQILELKKKMEKLKEKHTHLDREFKSLVRQSSENETAKEEMFENRKKVLEDIKKKQHSMMRLASSIEKIKKVKEMRYEQLHALEEKKNFLSDEMNSLKMKNIAACKNELNTVRKECDRLKFANNVLKSTQIRFEKENKEILKEVVITKSNKKNIGKIFQKFKIDSEKFKFIIFDIEKDKENLQFKETEVFHKLQNVLEQKNFLENENKQFKTHLEKNLLKLKRQNELYEKVRKERNFFSKNYLHAHSNKLNMKNKFMILIKQMKQLKNEIQSSEHSQFENARKLEKVKIEKLNLREEKERIDSEIKVKKKYHSKLNKEVKSINEILQNADKEKQLQSKQIVAVFKDRDILGNQLIKRDKEIKALYQEIEIQKIFLRKGRCHFEKVVGEVELLKERLKLLVDRQKTVKNVAEFFDNLKKKVFVLRNEWGSEKNKLNILKQELKVKMNIHRWRYLEGINPEKFEMILKLNTLQKKLMKIDTKTKKKRDVLEEKKKEAKDLKKKLERRPGTEIFEQIELFSRIFQKKERQFKLMNEQFNIKKAMIDQMNEEIRNLHSNNVQMKKKFFTEKKKEMEKNFCVFQPAPTGPMRIRAGGGFLVASVSKH